MIRGLVRRIVLWAVPELEAVARRERVWLAVSTAIDSAIAEAQAAQRNVEQRSEAN